MDKIGGDESSVIDVEDFDEIDFEMVEEVTEAMFSEQNAFYVEVLDGNYHYADIIGFSLVNEKGHYYIPTEKALGSTFLRLGQKMKRRKRQSMMPNVRKYHSDIMEFI